MVSHCRGINHDAFKIDAFHSLLELLKEFRPNAPLGPTVEFGVNVLHLPRSMGKALQRNPFASA